MKRSVEGWGGVGAFQVEGASWGMVGEMGARGTVQTQLKMQRREEGQCVRVSAKSLRLRSGGGEGPGQR